MPTFSRISVARIVGIILEIAVIVVFKSMVISVCDDLELCCWK